jgi:hypothetical protein
MASIKARKRYKNNPINFASLIITAYIVLRYVLESFWPLDHSCVLFLFLCWRICGIFVGFVFLSCIIPYPSATQCTYNSSLSLFAFVFWVIVQGWSLYELTIRKKNSQPVFSEESGRGSDFQSDPHTSSTISLKYGGFCLPSFSFLFFFWLRFRC